MRIENNITCIKIRLQNATMEMGEKKLALTTLRSKIYVTVKEKLRKKCKYVTNTRKHSKVQTSSMECVYFRLSITTVSAMQLRSE